MEENDAKGLAKFIDHTLLQPDATPSQVESLCREALTHGFAAVCVHPYFIPLVSELLNDSKTAPCTVVDFPFGAAAKEVKALSAVLSVEDGARELDMVMNLAALKSGDTSRVEADIRHVVQAVPRSIVVKVILETCYLREEEIRKACEICLRAGAHFVKTSTGFGPSGATLEAVRIMKEAVRGRMGIKASGGIRDAETAWAMIQAGATRIGASASLRIIGVR